MRFNREQVRELASSAVGPNDPGWLAELLTGIVMTESGGDPEARGAAGEIGLAQILPATANGLGVPLSALNDPIVNLQAAAALLREHARRWGWERLDWILSAYNGGIKRLGGEWVPRLMTAAGGFVNGAYVAQVLTRAGLSAGSSPSSPSSGRVSLELLALAGVLGLVLLLGVLR